MDTKLTSPPRGERLPVEREFVDRKRVREAIRRLHDLPCLLPVVRRAIEISGDPNCTNYRMEQILTADPAITARLLRLANSAYFGVSRQVSTISMAVALIGYERLRTMLRHILVAEVFELLSAQGPASKPIRRLAAAAGAACRRIAEVCNVGVPDEILSVGLLHNVGELVLFAEFGQRFLAACNPEDPDSWVAAQLTAFGVESGEAGQWLLDAWSFPPIFGAACAHWKNPFSSQVEDSLHTRLALVHAGVIIARCFVCKEDERTVLSRISDQVLDCLKLTPERAMEVAAGFEEEVERTTEFQESLIT